jgi:hypothetical protein
MWKKARPARGFRWRHAARRPRNPIDAVAGLPQSRRTYSEGSRAASYPPAACTSAKNNSRDAEAEYKQVLALDPHSTEAAIGMTNIYMKSSRLDRRRAAAAAAGRRSS